MYAELEQVDISEGGRSADGFEIGFGMPEEVVRRVLGGRQVLLE